MLTEEEKRWIKSAISDGVIAALNDLIIPEFTRIDQRFEEIESRVGNLEVLTDSILRTTERIEDRLETHDAKLGNHEHRLVKLETPKV